MPDNSQSTLAEDRSVINRLAQRLATQSKKQSFQNSDLNPPSQIQEIADNSEEINFTSDSDFAKASAHSPNEILQACYQRNMAALFTYEPQIYQMFCSYRPSEPLELIYTNSGVPDVFFNNNKEFFYKVDDPIALCEHQVDVALKSNKFLMVSYASEVDDIGHIHRRYLNDMFEYLENNIVSDVSPFLTESCPNAIVIGVGLGYHIGILYEKIEIANLIIIEPNADLFYASLYTFDWAHFLEFVVQEHRGLYIMVGQTKEDVFSDLKKFYDKHGVMLSGFMWSMIHYHSDETIAIKEKLSIDYQRNYSNLGFLDDFYFNISHASYLATHHARFFRKDILLPEDIREIPLCIVANGPSLSKDLSFLRKVQDKVLIMACGTALETLYNAGIQPLFYTATERLTVVAESLSLIPDQDYVKSTILISTDVCHPNTFKMFKDTALFSKADEVFYYMAGFKCPDQFRNVLAACMVNPLVANLGVVAAGLLKFKNVYLFGVDNGTKQIGLLHPEENRLYNETEQGKLKDSLAINKIEQDTNDYTMFGLKYKIPGNFGGNVYSSNLYKNSLRHIEIVIEKYNDTKYYNCSDGAMIEGAEPVHSADLLENWQKRSDVDTEFVKDFIKKEMTFDLNFTDEDIENISDHNTFYEVVDKLRQFMLDQKKPTTRLEYVFMLQRITEFLLQFRDRKHLFAQLTLNSSLNIYFIMIIFTLYLTADENLAIKHANRQINLIFDFLDDARRLYQYVPKYYGDDHRKFFVDGKVGFDHPDSIAPVVKERKPLVTQEDRDRYPLRKFVKRYD